MPTVGKIWGRYLTIFSEFGSKPEDNDDEKFKKSALSAITLMAGLIAVLLGTIFSSLGLQYASYIALGYAFISLSSVVLFYFGLNFQFFKYSQLILSVILPVLTTVILGGHYFASMVIVWSLLSPFGALVYLEHEKAIKWYFLFVVGFTLSGILGTFTGIKQQISDEMTAILLNINVVGISIVIFSIMYYYVKTKTEAIQLLNQLLDTQFSQIVGMKKGEEELTQDSVFFMISSNEGTALYSNYGNNDEFVNHHLVTGFVTAVTMISKEAFGTSLLKEISYLDFHLHFKKLERYNVIYAFRGDKKKALHRFQLVVQKLQEPDFKHIPGTESRIIEDQSLDQLVNTHLFTF